MSRQASVLQARLRLGSCALNDYLFSVNCAVSPVYVCKLGKETVKHYFLECPRYATHCVTLLASAAQLFGQSWLRYSDTVQLNCILNGSEVLNYQENCVLFSVTQQFILNTGRFAAAATDV